MRSLVMEICRSRFQNVACSVNSGLLWACSFAVLSASLTCSAGESGVPGEGEAEGYVRAVQLKMEARVAAEKGDFLKAASQLQAAARVSGDRVTADRAGQARAALEAGGGNMFADFSQLITLIQEQTSPPAQWFDIDGEGGRITQFTQGVFVGAPAILTSIMLANDDSRLLTAAQLARTSNQNDDVRISSDLRLVSLSRLENFVQQSIAQNKPLSDDVRFLAGLTEVRFLFLFPETGDVVIGGPAGDFSAGSNGRAIGIDSSRPTLQLDDLVTLSRTFSSSGARFFMCSIDPKQGQVKALNDYLAANKSKLSAATAKQWTESLQTTLGMQNVILEGLPTDSRVAQVIVEADYRMKEIGIGRREGVSGMKSYFELLSRSDRKGSGSMDALRWWMTIGYDAIRVSPDHGTYELTGRSIQCLSENQLVKADGTREATGKADRANAEFARLFTEHLPQLAEQDVVFADLQNVFDLALVSAIMNTNGLAQSVGYRPDAFASAGEYNTAAVSVPTELMTAAECRVYRGGDVVIQVAGGIRGDLMSIVRDPKNFVATEELAQDAAKAHPAGHGSNRWWWDASVR